MRNNMNDNDWNKKRGMREVTCKIMDSELTMKQKQVVLEIWRRAGYKLLVLSKFRDTEYEKAYFSMNLCFCLCSPYYFNKRDKLEKFLLAYWDNVVALRDHLRGAK